MFVDRRTFAYSEQCVCVCISDDKSNARAVFGNALVCLSIYHEKALHTVTNYFIVGR